MRPAPWMSAVLVACAACSAPPEVPVPDAGHWWDVALAGCLAQQGPHPRTVGQVVERIDALPRPVTIPCLVASLPRPLSVVATTSAFSAQPADGRRSPRVFLMGDPLILSIAISGAGKDLLEFAERTDPARTLKAEVGFPVTGAIVPDDAFARVRTGPSQTNCGLCHRAEAPHPTVDGGFVSAAFRPNPGELVPLAELKAELASCDPASERDRCLRLIALLGLGPTTQGAFPSAFELFIQ